MRESSESCKKRELTKPKSFNLQTLERMKIKGDIFVASGEKSQDPNNQEFEFKARPFNKKQLEKAFVPRIEKKSAV